MILKSSDDIRLDRSPTDFKVSSICNSLTGMSPKCSHSVLETPQADHMNNVHAHIFRVASDIVEMSETVPKRCQIN